MLECSLPERFEEGLAAAVIIRFRRHWRGSVETKLSLLDGERVVAGPAVRRGPEPEEGAEMSLNVRPPEAGSLSVEVRVERRYEGSSEPEVFVASLILLVQPRDGGVRPQFFFQNGPNSPMLGDISLGGALPRAESAAERLHAVANPRVFRPLPCTLVASPSRLTLRTPDGLLHLVSRSPAWFGRQGEKPEKGRVRDNAIVLHSAPGASPEAARAALCISRTHFLVEKDGPACRVRDGSPVRDTNGNILPGGAVSASRGGLSVGGETLSPCGFAAVPAGETRTVRLSPTMREGGVFSLDLLSVPSAEDPSVAAGALLRRQDGVAEAYLPLWGAADLGVFSPELRGDVVRWDGFRFVCGPSGAAEEPLAVGYAFGSGSRRCTVAPFSQL